MSDQLSLSARYSRALLSASSLSEHSALSSEYKQLSSNALTNLKLVATAISDLQLFSTNETLEDVSTRQLVYLSASYVFAELLQSLPSTEHDSRRDILTQAELEMRKFISDVVNYRIVDEETVKSAERSAVQSSNPVQRRETKIQQYQAEKQLKSQISALHSRSLSADIEEPVNNYDAIRALLNPPSDAHLGLIGTDDDDGDMDDETRRELSILLLKLLFTQANASLMQISQELQLLRTMPPHPPLSSNSSQQNQTKDNTWLLDRTSGGVSDGSGPLMDAKGRPLRPFTIMPSQPIAERTRLQQEVFRPDYRLPTMTIDEYLAEEGRRGNIISGGGKASEAVPTSSEQLAIDAQQDGTIFGYERSEEKRCKDEEWAMYADENPKGLGNTMNRG